MVTRVTGENLLTHRARTAFSAVGVACGVALVVAVSSLTSSIDASARAVAFAVANKANLEVRPAAPLGLPQDVAATVRAAPGVEVAGGAVEALTRVRRGGREERVLLLGFDPELVTLASKQATGTVRIVDRDGVVLPARLSARLGAEPHDELDVLTPNGWREVTVGGVSEGAADVQVVAAPLSFVQSLLGKPDRIDVVYVRSSDVERTEQALGKSLGATATVGDPAGQRRDLDRLLDTMRLALFGATLVAVFVGMFLVYNTMSMAAAQRMGDAAVLRAIGARRSQVFRLFLLEAAAIGLLGAAVGVPAGYLLAKAVLTLRLADLEQLLPILVTRFVVTPRTLVAAGLSGVVVAVLAGVLPALRIGRMELAPVLRAQGAHGDRIEHRFNPVVVGGAVLALGAGIGLVFRARLEHSTAIVGMTVVLAAVAVLVPVVLPLLASSLTRPLARSSLWARATVVHLAAVDVRRTPRRTAFTSGAVLLSVTLVVAIAVGVGSFVSGVRGHMSTWLQGDLYVRSATWQPFGSGTPLDPSIEQRLEEVPGVRDAHPFRTFTFGTKDATVVVYSWPFEELRRNARRVPADYARLLDVDQGDAVAVSQSLLASLGLEVGDMLPVPTPDGERSVRIAMSYSDAAALLPSVYMDWALFERLWKAPAADDFAVFLAPGASKAGVLSAIAALGPELGVEVEDKADFADRIVGIVGFVEAFMAVIQVTALIMAGLAVANTLFMAGIERRAEFASLRAIGMKASELQWMMVVQAMLLAVVGAAAGGVLGTGLGAVIHAMVESQLAVPIRLRTPAAAYQVALVGALLVTGAAAAFPTWRSSREVVAVGLRTE